MSSLPRRRVPIHSRFARSGDPRLPSIETSVTKMLVSEIEVGSFPSASWLVGTSKEILVEGAAGHSVLKPAKIATGFEIGVPIFVAQGDKVEIDTRTGEYRRRV